MRNEDFKDFMKPGRKVSIRVRNYWGNDVDIVRKTIKKVVCPDPFEDGKFVSPENWESWMFPEVETTDGEVYDNSHFSDYSPEYPLQTLDDDELKLLYKEVTFGSMYVADYQNSVGVDPKTVSDVCEGYTEELWDKFDDKWADHLNFEDFKEYVRSCEFVDAN